MVILGIGTNQGNRLNNLRQAIQHLQQIPELEVQQYAPIYESEALLPDGAPADWNEAFLNTAVLCQCKLAPEDLLPKLKIIEQHFGHNQKKRWAPRVLDIDILVWGSQLVQTPSLKIPHPEMQSRPFALWPVADLVPSWVSPEADNPKGHTAAELTRHWGCRFDGQAPLKTRQIPHRLQGPELVAIVNASPDSFAGDGGKLANAEAAHQYAHDMLSTGSSVIDVGAESTRPKGTGITCDEELQRLLPVLDGVCAAVKQHPLGGKVSVDTRHWEVAKQCLEMGVDWINDVSGLHDPNMIDVVADSQCDVVVMHSLTLPVDPSVTLALEKNPLPYLMNWAEERLQTLEKRRIATSRIILDPGVGFGLCAEQSVQVLKEIASFKQHGVRLLVGHSRKSWLSLFTDAPFADRDPETLATSLYLAKQPVDFLRVHNARLHARALGVFQTLAS